MGSKPRTSSRANLEFFHKISGHLKIELSEPPQRITPSLENVKAPPEATIKSVRLEVSLWVPETEELRELTEAELDLPVFEPGPLSLRGEDRHDRISRSRCLAYPRCGRRDRRERAPEPR